MRAIKLGAVNLFGVAIPGFLLLFFSLSGLVAPTTALALGLFRTSDLPGEVWEKNKFLVVVVIVILSYVAGYILRLSTPDRRDAADRAFLVL